jgi:hypothetical protein
MSLRRCRGWVWSSSRGEPVRCGRWRGHKGEHQDSEAEFEKARHDLWEAIVDALHLVQIVTWLDRQLGRIWKREP